MHNWDDYKFFLAVARAGSVSAAATVLGVNQSTVSRRINAFEAELNVRLFERLSSGYELTEEGKDLVHSVTRMEDEVHLIGRSIMGKNVRLEGPIRLTTSLVMVEHLLLPILQEFNQKYPGIEIQLDLSDNSVNLSRREADIALRATRQAPAENLVGRELGEVALFVYGDKDYLRQYRKTKSDAPLQWIGEDIPDSRPNWLSDSVENLQLTMRTNDVLATLAAVKRGFGVGRLPVFLGDAYPQLQRFKDSKALAPVPIWLLTHSQLRHVNRVRVLRDFLSTRVSEKLENFALE